MNTEPLLFGNSPVRMRSHESPPHIICVTKSQCSQSMGGSVGGWTDRRTMGGREIRSSFFSDGVASSLQKRKAKQISGRNMTVKVVRGLG